jgi:hypothetical protein
VGYEHGLIQGISRKILDPRRPINSPTSSEKEELLVPYHPVLQINPKEAATAQKIMGVEKIVGVSTELESTSVVISFGLDILVTKRTPSQPFDTLSEDFSYVQLLCSILALGCGIVVASFYADKKALNESAWKTD